MSNKTYDLLVLGGGSGGLGMAQRAARYGAKVAVIEFEPLGGTCVNRGCVPKKVMWYAANFPQLFTDAQDYGFQIDGVSHDWGKLKQARDGYVARLNKIYAGNIARLNIDWIKGRGEFIDAYTVRVGETHYQAKHICIATGGRPRVPSVPGAELGLVSDDFFLADKRPQRVAFIGSGYIAVELAGVLNALGSDVSLFIRSDTMLNSFDPMLRHAVQASYIKHGIKVERGCEVSEILSTEKGLQIKTDRLFKRHFDAVYWAVGRIPNTFDLGLDKLGVNIDSSGAVVTDEFQNTNVEHIYAIGDVTGRIALTPVAIAAGRRLADRIFDGQTKRKLNYQTIATVMFSHPAVGTVGLTEKEAEAKFAGDIKVYNSEFVAMRFQLGSVRPKTRMKMITAGAQETVVGIHVFGLDADELIQGFAVAVKAGLTKAQFDDTVAIHPTSAEELVTLT